VAAVEEINNKVSIIKKNAIPLPSFFRKHS